MDEKVSVRLKGKLKGELIIGIDGELEIILDETNEYYIYDHNLRLFSIKKKAKLVFE